MIGVLPAFPRPAARSLYRNPGTNVGTDGHRMGTEGARKTGTLSLHLDRSELRSEAWLSDESALGALDAGALPPSPPAPGWPREAILHLESAARISRARCPAWAGRSATVSVANYRRLSRRAQTGYCRTIMGSCEHTLYEYRGRIAGGGVVAQPELTARSAATDHLWATELLRNGN